MYDYLLVGCGLFNATFARIALDRGKTVLIIDRRQHLAGNCHDQSQDGILVHKYGPHQFHTRNRRIWDFVRKFSEFNHYRAHVKANYRGRIFSMPPNMALYNQLWGVTDPQEARAYIESVRIPHPNPRTLKELICDAVGEEIYRKFYYGYSKKQWNCDPSQIPVSIGKRLPIRFNWTDRWFDDPYEGIPQDGYTKMVERMIDGANVELGVDYLSRRDYWNGLAKRVVFTGKIDEYFHYEFGPLPYRSLRFEEEVISSEDHQGNAIINYTSEHIPYTRITEHKYFSFSKSPRTVITREYPQDYNKGQEAYYPIPWMDEGLYGEYLRLSRNEPKVIFGGRLGTYKYMDMDTVIGQALVITDRLVLDGDL